MSFYLFPILVAMLLGGENSLSGYLEPEAYWRQQGIAYEVDAMAKLLLSPDVNVEQMEGWVIQLGGDRFEDREAASQALVEMGEVVRPALEVTAKSQDPEVSQRAKKLLAALEPINKEEKRVGQMMAVYSLARMASPEAKTLLAEIAEGSEGEWQALAQRLLHPEETGTLRQTDLEVLSGFPETTTGFVQVRTEKYESALVKAIRGSSAMQEMLVKVVSLTGDMALRRVTLVVTDETFLGNQKQLHGRIELSYDPEKLKAALQKSRFKVSEEAGEMDVLTAGPLRLMLVDEQNILFLFSVGNRNGSNTPPDLAWLKGNGELPFSEQLKELMIELPESSMVRGAWLVPEKFAAKVDELAGVQKIFAQANRTENGIGAEMVMSAKDPAAAKTIRDYSLKEVKDTQALLVSEEHLNVRPYIDFFEKVKVVGDGSRVNIQAELHADVMQAFLNQLEKTHQQIQMRQLQIQQRMLNNRAVF